MKTQKLNFAALEVIQQASEFVKPSSLLVLGLTVGALLGGSLESNAQVTVKVDSTKAWSGYMNWYDTNDVYVAGGAWGIDALRASFTPNKASATRVILQVNTNTYNPADPYWNLPDGTGNKHLEANFYVDVGATLGGQDVTFVGTAESNSLPTGWTCYAMIKEFASGYAYIGLTRVPIVGGETFSVNRAIGTGNITQYGFITYGPNAAPDSVAALQAASIVVDNEDPSITSEPSSQRVLVGGTATFSVAATGGTPLSYQWKRYGTNLVNAPGKIAGATSATLTISNAQAVDDTTYTVTVTDTAGSLTPPAARLRVLTAAQYANCLDNPSFEEDYVTYGVVPNPWVNFTGSALLSSGDFAWAAPVEGTNVVQIFNAGAYNGIYQDVPAAPGDIFTGDCSIFQSSFDALTAPVDQAYLEVQFRHGNDAPIAIYNSILITNSASMQDAWLKLYATNGVAAGYAQTSTANSSYLVAPAGTDHVRYQVTLHMEGGGSGSVFVDVMHLMKKIPVAVASAVNGANIELSWLSQGATDYQVVYKDNLTDASWTPVGGVVAGDGTTKTASFPAGFSQRFYSVLTK